MVDTDDTWRMTDNRQHQWYYKLPTGELIIETSNTLLKPHALNNFNLVRHNILPFETYLHFEK